MKPISHHLAQRIHVGKRAMERYQIRYTREVREQIIGQILTKKAVKIGEDEGKQSVWNVRVREGRGRFASSKECTVVWDLGTGEIVTFLPLKRVRRNKMDRRETLSEKQIEEVDKGIRAKMESVSTPEAEFLKFVQSFNPVVTPEMEALNSHLDEKFREISSKKSEALNAFCLRHLDKVETHHLYYYPQKNRIEDGRNVSEELIALLPKGASPYTEAEVKAFFPHIIIRVDYGETLAHHPQIGDSE